MFCGPVLHLRYPYFWVNDSAVAAYRGGLLGSGVLVAAGRDSIGIRPWRVDGSRAALDSLEKLMARCLATAPEDRPNLDEVSRALSEVRATHVAKQ